MSGIYIKGMEMPTKCEACMIARLSETGESLRCGYTYDVVPWGDVKPPFDCPLVNVPDHGRLIDADAIHADIDEKRPGRSYEDAWALTVINAAPTIIPADPTEEVK